MRTNEFTRMFSIARRSRATCGTMGVLLVFAMWAIAPALQQAHAQAAGEQLSLPEALGRFAEQSPDLRAARARIAGAEGRLRQTEAYPNPNATVTYEPLFGGAGGYEAYFNLNQQLRWPGERNARIEAAEQRVTATRAQARADSLRGAYRVAELFVEAVAAGQRAQLLRDVVGVFRTAEERGSERLALGDFSGYSLRRVRIERARYETQLLRAEIDAEEARRHLTHLVAPTDREGAAPVRPVLDLSVRPAALGREQAVAAALSDRAELAAAGAQEDAARASLDAARLAWRPDPTVTAGYSRRASGNGLFLGVSVPLPLYHRNGGNVEAQEAALQAAEAERQRAERTVRAGVEAAYTRYAALRERLSSAGAAPSALLAEADPETLGRAEHLLDAARTSYAEGELSLVELLDAAKAYQESRLLLTDLRADLWTSYFRLLQAQGRSPLRATDAAFEQASASP